MHHEAICEAFNPAQTGGITVDPGSVSVPFTVYACTDLQEVATRSADIRLLRGALWAGAGSQTNKEDCKQCRNKK
jgi:hypothetical protein